MDSVHNAALVVLDHTIGTAHGKKAKEAAAAKEDLIAKKSAADAIVEASKQPAEKPHAKADAPTKS